MSNITELLANGFYAGQVEEILEDSKILDEMFKFVSELFLKETTEECYFRQSINNSGYHNERWPMSERVNRRKFVKDHEHVVFQQWSEAAFQGPFVKFFYNLILTLLRQYYPEIYQRNAGRYDNIQLTPSFALYEDEDFIRPHQDGNNPGRIFALILYLSEEHTNGGGELYLRGNHNNALVVPKKGNYVILDFTQNNVVHEVRPVKNGFKRFSYITFVSEFDKVLEGAKKEKNG